ncbi:E3 ubiquitin-protein ligase RMND5A-like [Antedon mediterranea]|uniref:E3 ubiquitin-protein ligase RMND5A-like n=1 Tax=Antedon mediterranea TaxID=105859 RepID=UPI003AF6D37D
MDACLTVEREVDKVLGKFNVVNNYADKETDLLLQNLQEIQEELMQCPTEEEIGSQHMSLLKDLMKKVKDITTKISSDHKELHSSVSKVGKAIDKNFYSDLSSMSEDPTMDAPEKIKLINEVICEHFLRHGMLDIADSLTVDAGLDLENQMKEPFIEINHILSALKEKNLQPALQWTFLHRERLEAQRSSLEFKLHRLKFIELLKGGPEKQLEALVYSRNFAPFAERHEQELQILMGSLLFVRQGLENSPYVHLLDPVSWLEIGDIFTRDACSLLGLSIDSPLSVSLNAGCAAIPALHNIKHVMQQRQCTGVWCSNDELPIEIDLGNEYRYHSLFACPILRQQSTENNPAMRLACGHAISRDSLNKLSNGNKIKCPYCPIESSPSEAKQLYF